MSASNVFATILLRLTKNQAFGVVPANVEDISFMTSMWIATALQTSSVQLFKYEILNRLQVRSRVLRTFLLKQLVF